MVLARSWWLVLHRSRVRYLGAQCSVFGKKCHKSIVLFVLLGLEESASVSLCVCGLREDAPSTSFPLEAFKVLICILLQLLLSARLG